MKKEGEVPESVKSLLIYSGAVFALILWQLIPNESEKSGIEHFFASVILGGGLWYYLALPYLRIKYNVGFCGWYVWLPTFSICLALSGELLIHEFKWLEAGVGGVIIVSFISFIATRIYTRWMCNGRSAEE
jgi:hypothetical protein